MLDVSIATLASFSSVALSASLGKYSNISDKVMFTFPSASMYDPFGMLLASAAIRQFKQRNPSAECYWRINGNGDASGYAGHMGFFKSISQKIPYGKMPGEAHGTRSYMPITAINLFEIRRRAIREKVPVQLQIQTTAKNLSSVLAQGNLSLEKTLTYVLREIIRNSEEHSRAEIVWVCAQHWPHYHLVEIAILDEGIGIKQSLKSNRYFSRSINSDKDALKLSLMPGVTEAYKRRDQEDGDWANSGYGLYIAKEICSRLNGMFLLASGSSCIGLRTLGYDAGPVDEETFLNGTAICLRFKTEQSGEFDEIRKTIIADGQSEARLVKNAIKKASYSSGGLIDLLK